MCKCWYFFIAFFMGLIWCAQSQQIQTGPSNLEALIQQNFGLGCVEISNITSSVNGFANSLNSYGFFEKGNSNFPFEDGILLTTGSIESAGNVLQTNLLSEGDDVWTGDSDLENALNINDTQNATSIEFDFISVSNVVEFRYLFASEEYYSTNPCSYSDGFAFLIKETGSSAPYTNLALIPNTTIPVNTRTIHQEIEGYCAEQNEEYFAGYNIGDTNYNGRTTILSAIANIVPDVSYHIKLVIADQSDKNLDSAVFIEGNSFTASVDLGPDITTCGSSYLLDGDIENSNASYQWFLNGAPISGANSPTLNATETGIYKLEISIQINNSSCNIEDEVTVTLSSEQTSEEISDYLLCDDDSNDNLEWFDLTTKNDDILASVPPASYNISYHTSLANAITNVTPLSSPYQNTSNPQEIFVRIEDATNGCLAYTSFNLVVNQKPEFTEPSSVTVCDDQNLDGFTVVDLLPTTQEMVGTDSGLIVTYHYNAQDAELGDNPIPSFVNTTPVTTLFIRILDPDTGCFSTTQVTITVLENPFVDTSEPYWINACEQDNDGFELFDLTSVVDEILQGLTGVSVTFHLTPEDASSGINPIANETNYQNVVADFQEIYIRIEDDATGCFTLIPIGLHANLIENEFITDDYVVCDDASNDGIEDFDLTAIAGQVTGQYSDFFNVYFYATQSDQNDDINILNQSIPYTVNSSPTTLYMTVVGENCTEYLEINLVINPPVMLNPIGPFDYCDDFYNDGYTSIELATFDVMVAQGTPNAVVKYYYSEDDALNEEGALPPFYFNESNPQIIWARVTDQLSNCFDIIPVEINIVGIPNLSEPSNILVCDTDGDGWAFINLEDIIPSISSNTAGLQFTFYQNTTDAENDNNPIADPTNFHTNTQQLHVRVENDGSDCINIVSFYAYINTLPILPDGGITDFTNCEADGNSVTDFFLYEKDEEILNGQIDKDVLYFETSQEAINRTNILDKYAAYANSTNPQTIYVRIENLTDPDCFITSDFDLNVGLYPFFNQPTDIYICDDESNDGFVTIDLNDKIDEISQGSTENLNVQFYTNSSNAQNDVNPITDLNFTNFNNPQELFVRIDNGTFCSAVTSFDLTVIQIPEVNYPGSFELCDDDGTATFNLSIVEFEILDIRLDNIVVSYHLTLDDVENDVVSISDPENFTNTSNPQTVYVKVNNTVSNCYAVVPIDIVLNLPPEFNDFQEFETCANANNSFDLGIINNVVVDNTDDLLITYFTSQSDAENNLDPLDYQYTYNTTYDEIFIRIENENTGCFTITSFHLVVNPSPIANQPPNLFSCDDDFDGYYAFNFSSQVNPILGTQSESQFTVSFFETLFDAINNENDLGLEHSAYDGQTIYAKVTNNSTGCSSITSFEVFVYRKPQVDVPNQALCLDNLPLLINVDTGYPNDTYLWTTGEVTPEIEILQPGSYSVSVTSSDGCITTSQFEIVESEPAQIEFTETMDFTDPSNITVVVSGIGDYLFVLDNGLPQESNTFYNVSWGVHTIEVIDQNGCSSATKEVTVIDYPLYFTPNNDGDNDLWQISGIEQLPGTVVSIFDRYGKLLKTLTHTSQGWDGTYLGENMPSSDYWFLAKVVKDGQEFEVKSHFTLKR